MASETNQISPPSSSPSPLPSTDLTSSSSSPGRRGDRPDVESEAPKEESESGQRLEEEEGTDEQKQQEEESQGNSKKRRITGPSTLKKLTSFTFDVRLLAATPETTPRFGTDGTFFQEAEMENKASGMGQEATIEEEKEQQLQQQEEEEEEEKSENLGGV